MKKICPFWFFCLFILSSAVLICSCNVLSHNEVETGTADKKLTILSWNVQALFDGEDQGTEYNDYTVSGGWSREKYEARLNSMAQGLMEIPENPDIIGFLEVENADILEHLVSSFLNKRGYGWTFFSKNPGGALGIGIISRHRFTAVQSHSITSNGETSPRPMVEIRLEVENQPLVLLVCHWKSKLGGEKTESLRRAAARIALRRVEELEKESPGIPIIIMGDLNENHDEFYRTGRTSITALLPDDPRAAELVDTVFGNSFDANKGYDFFVITGDKTEEAVYFNFPHNLFYTPWKNELENGSYFYRGSWETIDHFLLRPSLFDGLDWDFVSCRVVNMYPFIKDSENPAAYNPRTGQGLSDHFPLLLTIGLGEH